MQAAEIVRVAEIAAAADALVAGAADVVVAAADVLAEAVEAVPVAGAAGAGTKSSLPRILRIHTDQRTRAAATFAVLVRFFFARRVMAESGIVFVLPSKKFPRPSGGGSPKRFADYSVLCSPQENIPDMHF